MRYDELTSIYLRLIPVTPKKWSGDRLSPDMCLSCNCLAGFSRKAGRETFREAPASKIVAQILRNRTSRSCSHKWPSWIHSYVFWSSSSMIVGGKAPVFVNICGSSQAFHQYSTVFFRRFSHLQGLASGINLQNDWWMPLLLAIQFSLQASLPQSLPLINPHSGTLSRWTLWVPSSLKTYQDQ